MKIKINQQRFIAFTWKTKINLKNNIWTILLFTHCIADLKYQWMKGSSFLLSVLNKHFFVSSGGNLYFSEVQTSDDATYHCVVTLAALPGDTMATTQPQTETSMGMPLRVAGESKSSDV